MNNPSHAAQLSLTRPLLSFDDMVRARMGEFGGNQLYEQLIKDAATEGKTPRSVTDRIGCFVAGTLVHTKSGLVPIETIKAGDLVLSQPEDGGERTYKPLRNTFRFEGKEVFLVEFIREKDMLAAKREHRTYDDKTISCLVVTGNHPFWVKDVGWTQAESLEPERWLQLADGTFAKVLSSQPIYQTLAEGIGLVPYASWEPQAGTHIDLRDGRVMWNPSGPRAEPDLDWWESRFKATVYNFEVEDNHTYYVGLLGAWVHNTNCPGEITRAIKEAAGGIFPSHGTRHYFSEGNARGNSIRSWPV